MTQEIGVNSEDITISSKGEVKASVSIRATLFSNFGPQKQNEILGVYRDQAFPIYSDPFGRRSFPDSSHYAEHANSRE